MRNTIIHLFETHGHYYLYDVNVNDIVEINNKAYCDLMDNNYENNKDIKKLIEQGFLMQRREFIMQHPLDKQLEGLLKRNLKSMTLQVTKNCNLRCKYCVYSGTYTNRTHKNERMSETIAYKSIDFFLEHAIDSEYLNLGFYGGEPILEFDLIKKCIEYMENNKGDKTVTYSMTTNATLLTKEMIEFLNKYSVELTISLDGPKDIHNLNRISADEKVGSFNKVINSIQLVEKECPEYSKFINFNAVMTPEYGFEIYNKFFCEDDLIKHYVSVVNLPSNNYAKNKYTLNEEFIEEFNYELFKYYFSTIRNDADIKVSKLLKMHYQRLHDDIHEGLKISTDNLKIEHPSGPCVVGRHRLFVETGGDFYPCERVSECSEIMKIGNIYRGFDLTNIRNMLNIGKITEEKCRNCWAFRFCTICAVKADGGDKLSAEMKASHCEEIKRSVDDRMKDYCMFKEMGYDFEKEN
ncbi:Cys-rich peptide radical SAM maturase CcpM [Clostridium brassicae]|uniref:Cys-rich peptide radical SAM maturase CcpM n=1 Tax=Clostridium brassicae TaxID=2999072 RepID=A0ABT4D852_9CLOT|nr:Cys-rich peptide radical SAM maturase CcpM [Clostridium brassicae]MCY6958485.1 Cys-rich peptide radical SAM maturase CcpM [Clostridium brassicae]